MVDFEKAWAKKLKDLTEEEFRDLYCETEEYDEEDDE